MPILEKKDYPFHQDYIFCDEVLGNGLNGSVYSCIHRKTGVKYALKPFPMSLDAYREIDLQYQVAKECSHIVQIKDLFEYHVDSDFYLLAVMELMKGGTLYEKVTARQKIKPYSEREVARILYQICIAVKHLHSMGIAHRDIKLENLLLSSDDEFSIIKLSDFGFAKKVCFGLKTPCFSPLYVAPEVLQSEDYDAECDIWSLGVIMYILCCGYAPFEGTCNGSLTKEMKRKILNANFDFPDIEWSGISTFAKDLIRGMLEKCPEKRMTIDQVLSSRWMTVHLGHIESKLTQSFSIMRQVKYYLVGKLEKLKYFKKEAGVDKTPTKSSEDESSTDRGSPLTYSASSASSTFSLSKRNQDESSQRDPSIALKLVNQKLQDLCSSPACIPSNASFSTSFSSSMSVLSSASSFSSTSLTTPYFTPSTSFNGKFARIGRAFRLIT